MHVGHDLIACFSIELHKVHAIRGKYCIDRPGEPAEYGGKVPVQFRWYVKYGLEMLLGNYKKMASIERRNVHKCQC